MRRGVAPIIFGLAAVAIAGTLLYLTLTPTGHALLKSAINFVSDLAEVGAKAFGLLIQLMGISISIMAVSFERINTVTGLLLFVISLIGNFSIAYFLVIFLAWATEKIKNIIKP